MFCKKSLFSRAMGYQRAPHLGWSRQGQFDMPKVLPRTDWSGASGYQQPLATLAFYTRVRARTVEVVCYNFVAQLFSSLTASSNLLRVDDLKELIRL